MLQCSQLKSYRLYIAMKDQLILFNSPDGNVSVDVLIERETVWLTQKQIETLFERDQSVISRHIKNIFKDISF